MTWSMTTNENGWPKVDVKARHIKDNLWHLDLGLNGDGPAPEEAAAHLVEDAAQMLREVLADDSEYRDLLRQLGELESVAQSPARTLAAAETVLAEVAAARADPTLLQSAKLGELLEDLDRREQAALGHQRQARAAHDLVEAKLAKVRSALAARRKTVAQLVLERIREDIPKERQLVADAVQQAAGQTLTLLASVEAAFQAAQHPDLIERVLAHDNA